MNLRGKSIFFVLALLGTILDLQTKTLVFDRIESLGRRIQIVEGFFYFSRAENPGGVFGWFGDYGGTLMVVRAVALFVIAYFLLRADAKQRAVIWAYGFLFAGALGNLYDNLFNRGHVRDWLQFYLRPPFGWEFPTFNLADVFINVGVGLLLLHEFIFSRKTAEPAPGKTA